MQKTDDANLDIEFQIQGQWKTDLALAFAFEGEGVDDACHFTQNAYFLLFVIWRAVWIYYTGCFIQLFHWEL